MLQTIHDSLVALVSGHATAYPSVPMFLDNDSVDWNNLPPAFVTYEVRFYAGQQIGMSSDPRTRIGGFIYVTAYVRRGEGVTTTLEQLGWFINALKYGLSGGVILGAPEPVGANDTEDWRSEELKVQFHADKA